VRAGVKHIVFISAAGARQEEPALGVPYWWGEQRLIATAPAWTILRMNFYAESFVQQAQASLAQGVLTGLAENRVAFVARGDVAAAAAGILIGDGHAGAIYNATGPERLSGAERVRHYDRRRRAPWRPAAQASPRRACWGAENLSANITKKGIGHVIQQ